ncbi:hypothetical protein FNYG_07490 [Fusarium nygamai]|uniref:Uncharacterized protein n=1 Tax=Gibberella nygamai TaxID=42673 RepID=A0A2K0W9U0_GIBNY|nr:hypothetical protein FNYG_07490 [Fusarium nygamai]
MSDIPRINSCSTRKNSEGHEVMQNPEASSLDILETTENTDNVSATAKKDGNSIDNDSPPTKKKRTGKPRIPIKAKPRETPCVRCISRMADKGHEHVCYSQASKFASTCYDCARMRSSCKPPVGEAVELGKQLQNFARHIVDSQSACEEMPSVAPNQESQSVSEELEPAPSSNLPPFDDIQHFSTVPTHPIQSGQHYMAPPQGMSIPGSFAAPQYPPVF